MLPIDFEAARPLQIFSVSFTMTLDDHSYPSLPSELIDAVVDELIVDKDIPSLQKFALSHRSVVPKIQKFLFSDIELGMLQTHAVNEGQLPLAPAQKLYDAFQATPHLAEYVDTLALVIVNPSASADDNGESVARILPLLQNVRSLSIESRCSGRVLPDAVAKALALPSVTELRTSWVQLWLSLPSAFPSLRSLFCDNTEWIVSPDCAHQLNTTTVPEVEMFAMSNGYGPRGFRRYAPQILSNPPPYFSRLTHLDIGDIGFSEYDQDAPALSRDTATP